MTDREPPLIAHIVYRFAVGGLENGLVNLINNIPADRYRHVVISLTETSAFESRITQPGVRVIPLHKRAGQDWSIHARLWKMLKALRPAILHTRNLPTLECQVVGWCAGVRARVHGEHGRDTYDLRGETTRYNLLRRSVRPLVHRYIAVSRDLEAWLTQTIRVRPGRLTQIYNGVDVRRFEPRKGARANVLPARFAPDGAIVFGTAGRLQAVKDQPTLARAFVELVRGHPAARAAARLVIIGDGQLREECARILAEGGVAELAWLAGERNDVPKCLQALDVFILPSIAEGISNTILEAMATGLPVIATAVGGNPELVTDGASGILVPPSDAKAMAAAMRRYIDDRGLVTRHGAEGRRIAATRFALDTMVRNYVDVYDAVLARHRDARLAGHESPART
jgi:sugar transferase (PEP-CTERM/EpsH1 system associated)